MQGGVLALELVELIVTRGRHSIGPVSLQLAVGEQITVVGRNGAGKSSVLQAIAGLLAVTSGTISIAGRPMTSSSEPVEPWQRGIEWLGQDRGLWPHLSIEAQCHLCARDGGKSPDQIRKMARWLQIEDRIDRRPAFLSGGEAQRAELLRAVSGAGDLLLLDEPFSAQNQEGRQRIEDLLDKECQQGRSVLLALHQDDSQREVVTLDLD
ncbi:MAG: ATP-binding cassette domain-containing protein [Planctomycetota bacterium]|nr:ATP-binding cassette domain-containing protein [Planctomycetota bacterium]